MPETETALVAGSEEARGRRRRFLPYHEALQFASKPSSFLVEDLIPQSSLGIFVGQSGIGKSPLMMQLALSVAMGIPFLERFAIRKENAHVLYIDFEPQRTFDLLATVARYLGVAEPPETLHLYSPNYIPRVEGKENESESAYILNGLIEDPRYDLVIIDPLRYFHTLDENKNTDAIKILGAIRQVIKKTDVNVLIVHHPRKATSEELVQQCRPSLEQHPVDWLSTVSGAAALTQNTDFRIGMEENEEEGYLVFRQFLRGAGWYPSTFLERVYDDDSPIGYQVSDGSTHLKPSLRLVFEHIGRVFTTADLKDAMGGKNDRLVNQAAKEMASVGLIRKIRRGYWEKV